MARFQVESPTIRSYRELLGVEPNPSAEDLKKAYHRLAFLYHPDRNPDADAARHFDKVRLAYEVLKDPVRVLAMNRSYLSERLYANCIEGLNICFGSFFGYRLFQAGGGRLVPRALRLGRERVGERDGTAIPIEEQEQSILDHPAFDAIELVFAGKFSLGDEEKLNVGLSGAEQVRLPWVITNNQGILFFLKGDYGRALRCYEELNERIPLNIIFLYRLGICQVILAFEQGRRGFWGRFKPDRGRLEAGIKCLRQAIRIGEERSVGKQKCLVIRKILAEVLEKSGRRRAAIKVWREIRKLDPDGLEAHFRLGDRARAERLAAGRSRLRESRTGSAIRALNPGRGGR